MLLDSGADLISYGMGEHSILEIAEALNSGIPVEEITYIPGTVYKSKTSDTVYDPVVLPSYEKVRDRQKSLCGKFLRFSTAIQILLPAKPLVRGSMAQQGYVIQNPPAQATQSHRRWMMFMIFPIRGT